MKRLRLSGWNIHFTIIRSFWTSVEGHGCLTNWRSEATLSSASRQDVGRRQIQRL
jgi:hypothetical protein